MRNRRNERFDSSVLTNVGQHGHDYVGRDLLHGVVRDGAVFRTRKVTRFSAIGLKEIRKAPKELKFSVRKF